MDDNKVTSLYRLLGYSDNDDRMLLHDVQYEDCVWVRATGYDPQFQREVDDLTQGNLLEATVECDRGENHPWKLIEVERRSSTTIAYHPTKDFVLGPAEETWANWSHDDEFAVNVLTDDNTGEVQAELQLYPNELTVEYETADGEIDQMTIDTWNDLRRGLYPPEEWFRSLVSTDEGAHDIIVFNPQERPYIAMLAFPENAREAFRRAHRQLEERFDDGGGNPTADSTA